MTFLNPWMLLGGLAAAIPIALHFFYRARYRPQPWAAMKFLRLSIEQTSRRLRFQEVILLLLRILICIILALALARPALKSLSGGAGRGEGVDAILVIDNSYSMGVMEGEGEGRRSRFDRAREAAIKVIDHLPPHSTVQVISCSDKADHLGPRSTADLTSAKKLVDELQLTSQTTDFQEGLALAVQSFANTTGANTKEIYLFSDMQRLGWERQSAALRTTCGQIKEKANLYLVRVSDEKSKVKNAAIIDILSQDEVPHAGARVGFTVLVQNSGSEPLTNLSVTLTVDGNVIERDPRSIERIGPGEVYPVTITGDISKPGFKTLTARLGPDKSKQPPKTEGSEPPAELPADDLEEDNTYSRIVYVHERVRILLIDGAPNDQDPVQAASYSLGHALLPATEEMKRLHHIALTILPTERVGPGDLADHDVFILANVEAKALHEDVVRALGDFVNEGKGLIIIAGDRVVPKDYNAIFQNLLPLPLLEAPPIVPPKDAPLSPDLDSIDKGSFLIKFNEGGGSPLQTIGLAFTLKLLGVVDPKTAEDPTGLGRVLMRFSDGAPMLASKQVGRGEVLMLTTTADRQWGYFYIVPAFAPFINGCIAHLIEHSTNAFNHRSGAPLQWDGGDPKKKYYLVRQGSEFVPLGEPKAIGNGLSVVTVYDTSKAGIYRIFAEGEGLDSAVRFAVNPDLRESESFEELTPQQINGHLGYSPVHLTTGFDGTNFTGTERTRSEWTIWVLVALLIFGFGELIWAWVCGRSW